MDVTGQGEIDFISIIIQSPTGNEVIQICQDADFNTSCATPSVNTFLLDWVAARGGAASFRSRYMVYNNNGQGGVSYTSYVTAPFTTHTRITLANASGETVWWDIGYHLNSGLNWGRYSHLHAIFNINTYPVDNTTPLFSVSNGPGVIWGVYAYFYSVYGASLETEPQWNIDGNVNITSSGTEDYFGSSFDWSSGVFATDFLGCTTISGSYYVGGYNVGAYRLNVLDPIRFNSTAQFLFNNASAFGATQPATITNLVWYYTSN